MKIRLISILIILLGVVLGNDDQTIDSKVTSATIFKNQALVTRTSNVSLKKGTTVLTLNNLTTDIVDNTIIVKAIDNPEVKILDVKVEMKFSTQSNLKSIKEIQTKIEEIDSLLNIVKDEIRVVAEKEQFIESLKSQTTQNINQNILSDKINIDKWDQMIGFIDSSLPKILSDLRVLNDKKSKLEEKKQLLTLNRNSFSIENRKRYKNIEVFIEAAKDCKLNLETSYVLKDAGWYPQYDGRVLSKDKQLQLTYYGVVYQSTGEDWSDINLSLSTADPTSIKQKPELEDWFIDIYPIGEKQDYKRERTYNRSDIEIDYESNLGLNSGFGSIFGYVVDKQTGESLPGANITISRNTGCSANMDGKFSLRNVRKGNYTLTVNFIGYQSEKIQINVKEQQNANLIIPMDAATIAGEDVEVATYKRNHNISFAIDGASYSPAPPKQTYSTVSSNKISTTFHIPTKFSIPSDNSEHKTTIAIENLPITYNNISIPKLSENVYYSGKIQNTSDFPYLAGELNIFVDNNFINKTSIANIVQSDSLEITLGINNDIKIERNLANIFTEKAGLLNSENKVTYEYEIIVKNTSSNVEEVNIQDQLPISRNEKIEVVLLEPVMNEDELSKDKKLNWNISLNPNEQKTIPLKFQISYPKRSKIYGMN